MNTQELRQQSKEELMRVLGEVREKLRALKFDLAQGKVKNTSQLKAARRDIARTLSVLKEKHS